jgi:PAS domain S-box-containing protein
VRVAPGQLAAPVVPSEAPRDRLAARRHEQIAAAFDLVPDALLLLDDGRACVDLNRAACALFGAARAGFVGQRLDIFAPIELREAVAKSWPALLHDGYVAGEFRTTVRDGSRAWLEFTVQAGVAAGHHLLTLRDVTASRALDAERRNLLAVLDRSDDAICMCAHDGVVLNWNEGAEKLYGYTAQEAVGEAVTLLLPPAERASYRESWERAWRGDPVEPYEALRITKGARTIVVAVTVVAVTDEFGTATGVAEISRDVTAAKYAQATLSASQARAVESSRLQTQFLESMTHELRVPLSGVIGVTRLLEDTQLDAQQRGYVQGLRVSGEGLALAIQAVLDFSKLETGALELADEPYDLRALVEDVCSVVSLGAASEVDVLSYVEPELPAFVYGDEQRVRQVVATIAANAVKLTPVGEVGVTARVVRRNGAPQVLVEVRTGSIGIDRSEQWSVFEALASADDLTWRNAAAEGFGVTIADRLVKMMGGEVGVGRFAGEAAGFSFTLPLRSSTADPSRPPQVALAGVRVLVVFANENGRNLVARQLQDWDARVITVSDHEAALVALRVAAQDGEPLAIALIDHRESRTTPLNAAALTRAIHADPALRDTRTAVLVAARDASAVAAAADPDVLIPKPSGQTRLYHDLEQAIARGPRDPDAAPPSSQRATPPGTLGRVMVAEDNPVNQMVAVGLLEQRGFDVDVANDGREAVILHAHNQYDAIFMDCQMPGTNGYEATREIRRREGTKRHTPIIAMTASTLPSDRQRCITEGMDDHTGKPVRPAALDRIITRLLASRAAGT